MSPPALGDPTKPHTPVAVADVGKADADILADPSKHYGKTYKLVAPPFALNAMAAAFSKVLGKEVKQTSVSFVAAKKAFMGMGFPEWQTDGIMELYKSIDEDSQVTNESETGDIEKITGRILAVDRITIGLNQQGIQASRKRPRPWLSQHRLD
jgi:hypothetical protein